MQNSGTLSALLKMFKRKRKKTTRPNLTTLWARTKGLKSQIKVTTWTLKLGWTMTTQTKVTTSKKVKVMTSKAKTSAMTVGTTNGKRSDGTSKTRPSTFHWFFISSCLFVWSDLHKNGLLRTSTSIKRQESKWPFFVCL